jgi:hypothetical protein
MRPGHAPRYSKIKPKKGVSMPVIGEVQWLAAGDASQKRSGDRAEAGEIWWKKETEQ